MDEVKYIRTVDDKIIVFSQLQQHKEFEAFFPISAGFIKFGLDKDNKMTLLCYGESVSLKLKSHQDDTSLALMQILLIKP